MTDVSRACVQWTCISNMRATHGNR